MKRLLLLLLTFSLQLIYSQSNFQLQYKLVSVTEKTKDDIFESSGIVNDTTSDNITLLLFNDNSFSKYSTNSNSTSYFNIKDEMIIDYNQDTIFSCTPLFHILDYRIAEYKNRIYLTELLQSGGIDNALGNNVTLESIFGIENPESNVRNQINSKKKKDTITYSFNDIELVKIHYSKNKFPDKKLASFFKFLTYNTEIHPAIKEQIISTAKIPDYIWYAYTNIASTTTTTLHLKDAKSIDKAQERIDFNNHFYIQRNTSEIEGIIDSVYTYTLSNKVEPKSSTFYLNKAKQLSGNDQNLSGLLCLLEYLLTTGEQPSEQIREIASHQQSDTLLSAFLKCMNPPRSAVEAEEKIATLNELTTLNMEYGYVMNIFAANYIEQIDIDKSMIYFRKALVKNPFITGAWLDLGKMFANKYLYDDAWKCFDIMLRIKADHPMAKEIINKKEEMRTNYPNYFIAK